MRRVYSHGKRLCFPSCIASVLEIRGDRVPLDNHLRSDTAQLDFYDRWLQEKYDLTLTEVQFDGRGILVEPSATMEPVRQLPAGVLIVGLRWREARRTKDHAVVFRDRILHHDPSRIDYAPYRVRITSYVLLSPTKGDWAAWWRRHRGAA